MIEWDEIDAAAESEGLAIKGSFKKETPKRGINRSALSRDYRYKRQGRDLLADLNVIDGRATHARPEVQALAFPPDAEKDR